MKILFSLLFFINLVAQDNYSLRLAYGEASQNDLGNIISGNLGTHPKDLTVFALDSGYLLNENIFELPLDLYFKGAFAYFDEDDFNSNYELALYFKLYWNIDYFDNRIRVGFGEGVSYTKSILETEYLEAQEKNDKNSHILNYIDISLDFNLGRVMSYKPLYNAYLGYALKHRSGIFGLINDVKKGGSNYNTFYIEINF